MRRMNSMFDGVHGASLRTPFMYRSIARWVAGSSHDSGSRTVRDGTTSSVVGGMSSSISRSSPASAVAFSSDESVWICSDRMPGVSSTTPFGAILLQRRHERVHAHPEPEVERHVAVLDEEVVVAVAAVGDAGSRVGRLEPRRSRRRRRRRRRSRRVNERRAPFDERGRLRLAHGHEPDGVAGPQLAELPQLAAGDDRRADEAAERRAVRSEDDRGVAGEVDRADGVGGVVDVRGMQPGLAAVARAPTPAAARSGARRCGPSCSGPRSRWRRTRPGRARVKNSGAPCGPSVTPTCQSAVSAGRRSAGSGRRPC